MIEIFTNNLNTLENSEFPNITAKNFFRLAVLALRVFIYFVERYNIKNENKTD